MYHRERSRLQVSFWCCSRITSTGSPLPCKEQLDPEHYVYDVGWLKNKSRFCVPKTIENRMVCHMLTLMHDKLDLSG